MSNFTIADNSGLALYRPVSCGVLTPETNSGHY